MTFVFSYMHRILFSFFALALVFSFAPSASAQEQFEISAWIPYWRSAEGVESILPRLDLFAEVNPFMYTVKNDGTLFANGALSDSEWQELRREADKRGIDFVPTVMWAGSDAIHATLSDRTSRQAHIKSIATEVYRYDLDGIDIDYEAKFARTRPHFSQFLKELNDAIGFDRDIVCTIESRTPLDARYSSAAAIPADIEYANDFSEINTYCNRVRVMAYDQGRIDVKLNKEKSHPYVPVADVDWVEKVMRVAAAQIDPSKLIVGVPTYGYEYDMFTLDGTTPGESDTTKYSRLWSFNPGYADEVKDTLNIEPVRNNAGELFITYPARDSIDPAIPIPDATRVLSWSDAEAIRDKAELARELGFRGLAIFKIDGGEDQNIWNVLPEYANAQVTLASSADVGSSVAAGAVIAALPSRDLQFGDRSESVRALQKYLNQSGFTVATAGGGSPGNETTFFGPATRAALARFQAAHNIAPAVGYYGPITRATIAGL